MYIVYKVYALSVSIAITECSCYPRMHPHFFTTGIVWFFPSTLMKFTVPPSDGLHNPRFGDSQIRQFLVIMLNNHECLSMIVKQSSDLLSG